MVLFSWCLTLAATTVLFVCTSALQHQPINRRHVSRHTTALGSTKFEGFDSSDSIGRRSLIQIAGAALATNLIGVRPSFADTPPRNIVITGANSGIGFEASKLLAEQGQTVVLACRSLKKAQDAISRIREGTNAGNLIPAQCDLASMESIRSFANSLPVDKIDTLCLNAGVALSTSDPEVKRTADGFELTVGVNHFGHFYLNHLLLGKVDPSQGRIVVTASGVHDPESPGGAQGKTATLGNLEGLKRDGRNFEMVDGEPHNGDKAYKDSKLCNVLFTRELQRKLNAQETTKGIVANCFSPGLITSTGLFRNQNPAFSKAFDIVASKVAKVAETPQWGGASLVYVADQSTRGEYYLSPPGSSKYGYEAFGREFTIAPVSKEAQDDKKAKELWDLSEKLLNIA